MDRKGDKAVHFVSGGEDALQEGKPVLQKVDWDRRWVVSMPYEFMMVSMIINIVEGKMISKCPKPILQKVDWARRQIMYCQLGDGHHCGGATPLRLIKHVMMMTISLCKSVNIK